MSRTKQRRGRPHSKSHAPRPVVESRAAETVTICWMLAVLLTLGCEVAGVAANLYVWQYPDAQRIQLLAGILLFAAVVLGVMSLMMMPVVWKSRRLPPPRALGIAAVLICAAPPLTLVLRLVTSG